jgi:RND family efflux transporter MFP subunit
MKHSRLCLTSCLFLLLCSCGGDNKFQAPPAPSVTAQTVEIRDVILYETFPGRVEARDTVNLIARVSGVLEQIHFEPGAAVKEGDLLFTIEQEAYIAALNVARAEKARAEAGLSLARASLSRKQQAFQSQAVSELDILSGEADVQAAEAALKSSIAGVDRAELNLSYTTIFAPMNGVISRNFVSVGNVVGPASVTQLARLVSVDKADVFFNMDERRLLPRLRTLTGDAASAPSRFLPVKLELADGEVYNLDGVIDYVDNALDPNTGTLQVRAVFANPERLLFSGMFARVKIPVNVPQAMLIPEIAIQRDLVGPFVFSLDSEDRVNVSYLELGALTERMRIVRSGLKPYDRVVVTGIQRVRPGVQVNLSNQRGE